MIKVTCTAVVALAIGAGLGWNLHSPDPLPTPVAAAVRFASPTVATPVTSGAGTAIDVGLLRSVMREELAAALANQHGDGTSVDSAPKIAPPASPELVAQRQEAMREIESMVDGAEWGNEQRLGFQQRLALLAPDEAQRVLRQVVIGLNQGTIRVTTDGPPL
jgi:hypothetical protein